MVFIVKRDPIVIPAGIPVASTNTINGSSASLNDGLEFTLSKISDTQYSSSASSFGVLDSFTCQQDPDNPFTDNRNAYMFSLVLENGVWYFRVSWYSACPYPDGLNTNSGIVDLASVPQANDGYIPIDGWGLTIYAA